MIGVPAAPRPGEDAGSARMGIFTRYVFRQAAGAFLLILLSLTGIVWIALALRQLNVVTSQGQDTMMLVKMTTLALPNLMAIIAPFSFLIAALHTLNRLNTDSELIVLSAAGSTVWTTAKPLIVLALVVSAGLAFVNHLAQPWSMQLLKQYIVQVRTDLLTQVMQPGRFSSPEPNLTFHIRERALNGELLGLLMHDTREKSQAQSYLAERGQIVKQDPTAYLVMSAGHIIRRTDAKEPPQIIAFDRYAVDLDRFEAQDGGDGELKPRERYFSELYDPGPDSRLFKAQPGQFRSELHERFANPLYPVAFALLVVAFVGQARSTRSSRMENLVVAFLVAAGARLGGLAVNNLVAVKASFVPVLYGLPLAAMIVGVLMIKAGERQRSGPAIGDRVHSLVEPMIANLQAALTPLLPKRLRGRAPQ
ncbi:MAG TPA: LPS export ABC transporter permease LptF [Hyphomicrobium sp.]|nr:LPS export ABC transporter permease LptF [Hyphomicrobium sp.]